MPLGGLGMVLLAGFVLKRDVMREELGLAPHWHVLWLFMVRYVSPMSILVIFVDALGIAQLDFGAHWPWLLAALVVAMILGEWCSPRLRQTLAS